MKNRGPRWAVGLISGTSMDGIDAALVEIHGPAEQSRVRLESFGTFPFPAAVRNGLLRVASGGTTTASEISRFNVVLGELFAETTLAVCRRGRISPKRLTVIGSHGQTIFHSGPQHGKLKSQLHPASTFQIGEPSIIAERTGAPVVADFRAADIAAGGQGAPLVPIVDYLLLRDAKFGTIALNLGGIANITVIPASSCLENVSGFDTGPANMVLDGLVRHHTRGHEQYDAGGQWASRGVPIEPLLTKILRTSFIRCIPPKSAGREQFGSEFIQRYFLSQRNARPEDLLRTATELTARSVAQAITKFVLPRGSFHRLIISGGGAHNQFLIRRLAELLPKLSVRLSEDFGLPVDAKEAIAFALLADRTMHGLPGNLPAVTGAHRSVVLGKIIQP